MSKAEKTKLAELSDEDLAARIEQLRSAGKRPGAYAIEQSRRKTNKENPILEQMDAAIKQPYAWPGGYPIYCYTDDGETAHPKCVEAEYQRFRSSTLNKEKDGYQIIAVDVYWEGPDVDCCICNKPCESAYGDPEDDQKEDHEPVAPSDPPSNKKTYKGR